MIELQNIAKLLPPYFLSEAMKYQEEKQDFFFSVLFFGLVSGGYFTTIKSFELTPQKIITDNREIPITKKAYKLLKPLANVDPKLFKITFDGCKQNSINMFKNWHKDKYNRNKIILNPPKDFYLYSTYTNTYYAYLYHYKLFKAVTISNITQKSYSSVHRDIIPQVKRAMKYYDYNYDYLWNIVDNLVAME